MAQEQLFDFKFGAPQDDDGPAQMDVSKQYPNATRIEDGVAYDIKGKALGPVQDSQQSSSTQDFSGWTPVGDKIPAGSGFDFGFGKQPAQDFSGWTPVGPKFDFRFGQTGPATSIGPRERSTWEKIKSVITSGIPQFSDRTIYNPKYGREQFLSPEEWMSPLEQQRHPIITGTSEILGSLSSPENLSLMAGTSGFGTRI